MQPAYAAPVCNMHFCSSEKCISGQQISFSHTKQCHTSQETMLCTLKNFSLEVSTANSCLKRINQSMQRKTGWNSTWLANRDALSTAHYFLQSPLCICAVDIFSSKLHNLQRPLSFPLPDFFPRTSLPVTPGSFDHLRRSLLVLLRAATALCMCVCERGFCLMLQWAAAEEWLCPPQPVCFGPLPLSDLDLVTKILWMSGKLVSLLHAVNNTNLLSFLFKYQ